MSYEYRGFDLNEYLEEPWYNTEQGLFTDILDFLPEKGDTLATGHYHSYIASASNQATIAASSNNDGTLKFNQYTTNGFAMLCGGIGTVVSSQAAPASYIADGSVSNTEFQHLNGVETGIQAQIDSLAGTVTGMLDDNEKLGYFVDLGVTGIPVQGDGLVDDYLTSVGSAIYSSVNGGTVFYMGEAGFTGTITQAGCKFVINPIRIGDDLKFVHGGADITEYASIGYTGSGSGNDAELHIKTVSTSLGNTTHINIQASYGKIKLTSGTGSGNENGVLLTGRDANDVYYQVAAAGTYRDLYANEDGDLVVGSNDKSTRYAAGGFTGTISSSYMDANTYTYIEYEIEGDTCTLHLQEVTGNSTSASMTLNSVPSALRPSGVRYVQALAIDYLKAPSGHIRPAVFTVQNGIFMTWYAIQINATSGEPEMYQSFGDTGTKGWPAQTVSYRL